VTITETTAEGEAARIQRVRRYCQSGLARSARGDVPASAVARDANVAHTTVLRWERGERTPSGQGALRYLAVLDRLLAGGR
jgi:DNA-binding transcriptional regulator YiaG